MLERIKKILEFKDYSSSRFADEVGLPRPVISHILSGRNKPSLEVVQKILKAFPELSIPWLVLGQGPMLNKPGNDPGLQVVPDEKSSAESLPGSNFAGREETGKVQNKKIKPELPMPQEAKKGEAEKIIILYADNTFREFEKRPDKI